MLVSNLGSIVIGLVLDRTVAIASALAPGMAGSELSVSVQAVLLVIGWSAAANIAHPGFEHRSLRLWLLQCIPPCRAAPANDPCASACAPIACVNEPLLQSLAARQNQSAFGSFS